MTTSGWTCHCQADHAVSLRLEARMEDVSSDDEDDENHKLLIRNPFHVLFRYGHRDTTASKISVNSWDWDEADIHVVRKTTPSMSTGEARCGKGVRFASQARKAVKAALDPQANLRPIKDLCSALQTLQLSERNICLTILEEEIAKQKYGLKIYPTKVPPQDTQSWSILTLRTALQRGRRFPKRDRVRLAVTLASSVLQLHETPWLDDSWGIDHIHFVERSGLIAYDQPFVLRGNDTDPSSSNGSIPKHLSCMIQIRPLFALGVTLIELWYGKSLSDLHEDDDGPQNTSNPQVDFITKFNTAYRLADELADDAGAKYSDAVRRCIRCDFSLPAKSLEDVQLQKAVFDGVVSQLKATQDFMC